MDDAQYVFTQDVIEKKKLAESARSKVRGGGRAVKMPSDYLTTKQRKELNSKVTTFTMNEPHTLNELKKYSPDIQRQYLAEIMSKYNPSVFDLRNMLHVTDKHAKQVLADFGIERFRGYRTPAEKAAWKEFIDGKDNVPKPVDNPVPVPAPLAIPSAVKFDGITYITMIVTGKPYVVANNLPLLLDPDRQYRFRIQIEEGELPCDTVSIGDNPEE